jgi:hypothetical protein
MKKYKLVLILVFGMAFFLDSCIKHEVIPAPVPMVKLSCHFVGVINGSKLELTENVNNYKGKPTKNLNILPAPAISSAAYNFEMSSTTSLKSIRIVLGSVEWDASLTEYPALSVFNSFHTANTSPNFSTAGSKGFEVAYRDASGVSWISKQTSSNQQSVTFSGIVQDSDTLGDYSKFRCSFNCYVYHQDPTTLKLDSFRINDAVLEGWFQR